MAQERASREELEAAGRSLHRGREEAEALAAGEQATRMEAVAGDAARARGSVSRGEKACSLGAIGSLALRRVAL